MRIAFTMDDLPVYPHLGLPEGYTPASVAESIIEGLDRHKVGGVYAFANSWPLDVDSQTRKYSTTGPLQVTSLAITHIAIRC